MAKNIDVEFKGAIFDARKVEKILGQETSKILDEAALFGETAVKTQLFPTHGLVTGFLRESVAGTRVSELHAIIDAGEVVQGKNVVYANFIEGLYSMFRNSWSLIRGKNLPQLLARRVASRLNG
tara:strand:- start:109 stop:480 length:372 start_codon:yes stop_codon:yes gene_type:complete